MYNHADMRETDFDLIWEESLKSATGLIGKLKPEFPENSPLFQEEFEGVLDCWTQTPKRPVVESIFSQDGIDTVQINHPEENDFSEEDLLRIAKLRFLGSVVLETAKKAIKSNDDITGSPASEFWSFDVFQASHWFKAHKGDGTEYSASDNYDSEVSSPLRLAEWPKGPKMNCLGIAIACCAAAEMENKPYLFGTEVRNAMYYVALRHDQFMAQVKKVFPVFSSEVTRLLLEDIHDCRSKEDDDETAQSYKNILYRVSPSLVIDPEDNLRDFHHYCVVEYQDEDAKRLVQVDPYGLILRTLELPFSAVADDQGEGLAIDAQSVLLTDESEVYNKEFLKYHGLLTKACEYELQLKKRFSSLNPKSSGYAAEIIAAAHQINLEMHRNYFGKSADENLESFKIISNVILETIFMRHFSGFPEIKKCIKDNEKLPSPEFISKLCEAANHRIKYDTVFRADFVNAFTQTPYINLLDYYAHELRGIWQVRGCGTANPVAELADPKFMIGAMYMNHYATWRKDGRINIARHLARLNPSQFLWQAARQDDFVDERVNAVGEIVKHLKPRQRHPLVNIASALPTPK